MSVERPVTSLTDEEVLELCDAQMPPEEQSELNELLEANREGTLDGAQQDRLDVLMQKYRRGLVRKAQAWQVAVQRGLREPLPEPENWTEYIYGLGADVWESLGGGEYFLEEERAGWQDVE
jgi:hypothetical protein